MKTTGHDLALLLAHPAPDELVLPGGQTLLVSRTSLGSVVRRSPSRPRTWDGVEPFALSNASDLDLAAY